MAAGNGGDSEEAALTALRFAAPEFARPGFAHAEHLQRLVEFVVVFREDAFAGGLQQGGAVEPGILDARVDGVGVERAVRDGPEQGGHVAEGGDRVDPLVLVGRVEQHRRTVVANG